MKTKLTLALLMTAMTFAVGCSPAVMPPNFTVQAGYLMDATGNKERSSLQGREFGQCVAADSTTQRHQNKQGTGYGEIHRTDCAPSPEPSPIEYYE